MDKKYTNVWFEERGGRTWDKLFHKRGVKTALEIGCYEGQASVWLLEKFKNLKLTVIDIFDAKAAEDWDGYVDDYEDRFDHNVAPYGDRVEKIKSKSFLALATLYLDGRKYDFIYVDGDHRKLPAMQDCVMSLEMLEDNGIMVVDDYANIPWLHEAMNSFVGLLDTSKYKVKTTPDGEQLIIKRTK